MGVLFCLVTAFTFICCINCFALGPTSIFFSFALVVFYGVLATQEGSAWERNYPSTYFMAPFGFGSAFLALYVAVKIYVRLYAPYFLAISGREYHHVPPSGPTALYADGGILHFTNDTSLDTSRSFGFKGDDFTYCVAPVVSRHVSVHPHSSGPLISFWAVGKDCCGNRGNFECDGAGDMDVTSAFTVNELARDAVTKFLVPKSSRENFLKAVSAAKALYHLRSDDEDNILLVRWAADPKATLGVWHMRAIIACLVACVSYIVIAVPLWCFIHLSLKKQIDELGGTMRKAAASAKRSVTDPFMLARGGP